MLVSNRQKNRQFFKVTAGKNQKKIEIGSETEFITEHYWGYAKVNDGKTNEYEVKHPRWVKYDVIDYKVSVDFNLTFGKIFGFLNEQKPVSVMLAEGSIIAIENKKTLK